ncbi:hypothetical protein EF888_15265 [Silicimonas algicola]|uniref:Pyridoxamine 5'-phosphate oxidase n=1 Tax=Silicimonas algicola TaxID=1826607 RepID=A0A316FYU1_9RHOB|nr:hypothetical protein [Silicimonas algicola]AZQ68366.1 hypothetical protein EF888_15265 [Silicimonas algicola]PWK53552.1 hypothetical protein C8D95_11377 [Silicimonas algicola]
MATLPYATPTDDQISWRDSARDSDLLPAHLVAFLQCGVSITLGARGRNGRPVVGAGVACRVSGMANVRVFLSRRTDAAVIDAVEAGSPIAATFSRARDHRSIQLKATRAVIRPTEPDDASEAARQCALLADDLVELGYARGQADVYAFLGAEDLVSLEFRPERIFTQTPGPGAGAELPR